MLAAMRWLALGIIMIVGCEKKQEAAPPAEKVAPVTEETKEDVPTPKMPAGWKVKEDHLFARKDIAPIEKQLGGELFALRNTTYDVEGEVVQVNTIVAGSNKDLEAILKSLEKMKPKDYFLQKGMTVYEFVAKDSALAHVQAGVAHLKATAP